VFNTGDVCRGLSLGGGDILVLMSDGVAYDDCGWLDPILSLWRGSASELAQLIAKEARDRRADGHQDDITAAAMIVRKGKG